MAINNFMYQNPVRILFGRGQIDNLSKNIEQGKKVLIIDELLRQFLWRLCP